jgi:hypothetical protein
MPGSTLYVTLDALVDDGAAGGNRASVTNAVVLRIVP